MEAAKRVAKNTGILYARMAITVFISLYSTRLILAALGVADFGLFNVVGGVISMLGFLNSSMAAATQRFMSFAQGAGDLEKVKRIFNMSSLLHWGIAVLVFILLEGAGYFFFHGILNIASDRLEVAKLIYQFMIISTLFTVISVPYEAVITSHENMLVYAVMGVIEAVLKLGIAFYITYTGLDHLVMYGVLMAALSICLLIIKRIYCHRVYVECHLNLGQNYDMPLLKEIGGFAGWSLFGNSSIILANYGATIILNIFFGSLISAAQAIVNQTIGQLNVLANTIIKALNPAIDKSFGAQRNSLMLDITIYGCKISFYLLMILYIPFFIELPFIFKIWLKNVPEYTFLIFRILIIKNLIEQLFIPLITAIGAKGDIKYLQLTSSILFLIPLPISFLLFQLNYPPFYLYIVFTLVSVISSANILIFANKKCQLSIQEFLTNVVLRCFISLTLVFIISIIPHFMFEVGIFRLVLVSLISLVSFFVVIYLIGLSKNERNLIRQVLGI